MSAAQPHDHNTSADFARWRYGFHVLVVGALACLTIPRAAQLGMFVDGVTYAAIARNLAIGAGSLWRPYYTDTVYPAFHEQPPLGMALQALWFGTLGDAWWVERAYALAMLALTGVLIVLLWRRTVGARGFAWLPLVFWMLPSTVTWAAVNNMLENTQVVFTTLAVFAFLVACETRKVWWGVPAGGAVVAAVLVKGPVGLFPIFAPVALAVAMPSQLGPALASGAAMFAGAAASAGFCIAVGAAPAIRAYADQHLVPTIAGPRGSGRRLSQFTRHLATGALLRMGALLGVLALVGLRSRRHRPQGSDTAQFARAQKGATKGWTLFFWLLALAASLPIAFSGRIAGHYFVPAIPIFALAFGSMALPFVSSAQAASRGAERARLTAGILGVALVAAAVLVPLLIGPLEKRDTAWVQAFQRLEADIPRAQTIGTCPELIEDWSLHAYAQRLFRVSLDAVHPERHEYFWQVTGICGLPVTCDALKTAPPFTLARCSPSMAR